MQKETVEVDVCLTLFACFIQKLRIKLYNDNDILCKLFILKSMLRF